MHAPGFAFLHMELNVEKPVFAGDTIHVECEVIEARLSRNRPGRELVREESGGEAGWLGGTDVYAAADGEMQGGMRRRQRESCSRCT